eukprot:5540836-Pyramimonas_sp.AAC.1
MCPRGCRPPRLEFHMLPDPGFLIQGFRALAFAGAVLNTAPVNIKALVSTVCSQVLCFDVHSVQAPW